MIFKVELNVNHLLYIYKSPVINQYIYIYIYIYIFFFFFFFRAHNYANHAVPHYVKHIYASIYFLYPRLI